MHVADMVAFRVGEFDGSWRFELHRYIFEGSTGMLEFGFLVRGLIR